MAAPKIAGILETAIHVEDMKRAVEFYEKLFQFEKMEGNDRFCAFNAGRDVFLLFRRGGSTESVQISGGVIPPHGSSGVLHFAFAIAAADWDEWMKRLEANGVAIESVVRWPLGGRSMYFRDPDNHLVELVTPGTWPIY
ncbi:MAG: VOC family protein [Candidatus Acidiferrales bacterium]